MIAHVARAVCAAWVLLLVAASGPAGARGGVPAPQVTTIPSPPANVATGDAVTAGLDGSMWLLSQTYSLARVRPGSPVRTFTAQNWLGGNNLSSTVVTASDGALWFDDGDGFVGRFPPSTRKFTRVLPPRTSGIGSVSGLVPGPAGSVYYGGNCGRGTQKYALVNATAARQRVVASVPVGINGCSTSSLGVGPDGNLYVPGHRITPSGHVTSMPVLRGAYEFTAGNGDTLWYLGSRGFTQLNVKTGRVRVVPYAELHQYQYAGVARLAPGPDGNMWFVLAVAPDVGPSETTAGSGSAFGIVGPDGQIRVVPIAEGVYPQSITAGPDGDLWIGTEAGYVIHVRPGKPAGGWPAPARPTIRLSSAPPHKVRLAVRCYGSYGLFCGGTLTLTVRAGRRSRSISRPLALAANGVGADLVSSLPQLGRSQADTAVTVTAEFRTKDFLGRRTTAHDSVRDAS